MSAASPLGDLELIRTGPKGAVGAFNAPEDGPVMAGHYPGFPVLPGVFLIEAADRTVRQWAKDSPAEPSGEVELVAMDRCRFHRPVFPGDRVRADVTVADNAAGLLFKAAIATNRGKVADIRLRYRVRDGRDQEEGTS
ncbi:MULTISPECIES: 3-hydroxyacyl-ACP dehydratase FabZ family protein [unclassified Streptomyces]|uniref:3-hydroxyacyl-ACP dehydratase FabZ family protein n=1 Tax=unclassified Streptomyces TaxID=2593676 RepID=UPI00073C0C7F|nr:MaoC/PaaZ C-terminal domain-containing protein [Streptomyces sp. AVP053U2]ODA71246.1 3-hydroxyacyl-[acyl-carrier-protein] dehydratase FabZ [Streptomyces sp. AVP053U2]